MSSSVVALDDVTLTIARGEFVAIEGESGSGKSTLLALMGMLDAPSSGRVLLDERETPHRRDARAVMRSSTFAYVFQSFHLLERRPAVDSVAMPLQYRGIPQRRQREIAVEALATVGMADYTETPGRLLSGGQRQRVAIARALASGAPILIADEPTGNLDARNTELVLDALERVRASGAAVVVVTHSDHVASRADRRIRMVDGRVVSDTGRQHVESTRPFPRMLGRPSRVLAIEMLRDAARNTAAHPARLLGLAVSIAVAVALVVVTLGLSFSASHQVSAMFDLTVSTEVSVHRLVDPTVPLPSDADLEAVRGLNGVLYVADATTYSARFQSGALREATTAPWVQVTGDIVSAGRLGMSWAGQATSELGPGEAIVGEALAHSLSLASADRDPTVYVDGVPYTVLGVIDSSPREAAWIGAVLTGRTASTESDDVANVTLVTTALGAAAQVAAEVQLSLDPTEQYRLRVVMPPDPSVTRASVEGSVQASLAILTTVAVLGGVAGVGLASSISAAERRVEFGLRRALGARSRHLAGMLTWEAIATGAAGAALGLTGGLVALLAVTVMNGWTPVLDLNLVGVALCAGVVIAVTGSVVGGARALRMQPNQSLRPVQ